MRPTLNIARSIRDGYITTGFVVILIVVLYLHHLATQNGILAYAWITQPRPLLALIICIDCLLICWKSVESTVQDRYSTGCVPRRRTVVLAIAGGLLAMLSVAIVLSMITMTWSMLLFIMAASRLFAILMPTFLLAAQQYIVCRIKHWKGKGHRA